MYVISGSGWKGGWAMMSRKWRDNYNDWEEVQQLIEELIWDVDLEDREAIEDKAVDISNVAWDRINTLRREEFEARKEEEKG